MRVIVLVGFLAASTASAADFGIQIGAAEQALRKERAPLSRVECNPQRCVFQNRAKDVTAFLTVDASKTVTGFYLFYQPTNWAIAAEYAAQIQSALKVPQREVVDVRAVAEAGKDGKQATAASKAVSCRTDGDGSTPTIICERT